MIKLILTLFVAFVALGSWAQTFTSGSLRYTIISATSKTAEVIGLSGSMPAVLEIPNTVPYVGNSYKVTNIRIHALPNDTYHSPYSSEELTKLQTLIVGNNVTELPESFIEGNSKLKTIQLGSGLKKIGARAFADCSSLESIVIPDGVESVGSAAFMSCTSLKNVKYPNSSYNNAAGHMEFYECPSLETIDLGANRFFGIIYPYLFDENGSYPNLLHITMRAKTPPANTYEGAFPASVVKNTYLHVPEGCAQAYKNHPAYQDFKAIVDDVLDVKCADPEIQVSGGRISFSCDTPGVTFKYTAIGPSADDTGNAFYLYPYVRVSVQATKSGCEPSNTVTKNVPLSDLFSSGGSADVNADGNVNSADVVEIYNYITSGGH